MKNYTKLLIGLLPAIMIGYLLYSNFVANQEFNHLYDIGSEGEHYLSPTARISEQIGSSYRELTGHLVYFDIPIPRGADSIIIKTRFKDNFPENTKMSIGARDQEEWHYLYNEIYDFKAVHPEKPNVPDGYEPEETTIATALRGAHTFYIYTEKDLELHVEKQDINWYEGEDPLRIEIWNTNEELMTAATIEDDGITGVNKDESIIQKGDYRVPLKPGVYKIVFSDFDGLITKISVNTNKIAAKKLFLAGNEVYNVKTKPSRLFISAKNPIKLSTYHKQGLQNVSYDGKVFNFDTEDKPVTWDIEPGEYELTFPNNDIIVGSKDWMSFSKETYFKPFTQDLTQDWIIAETTFNMKDLYVKNNKLSLVFNIPHLSKEEYKNNTIPLDWIDITVYKPGLFK